MLPYIIFQKIDDLMYLTWHVQGPSNWEEYKRRTVSNIKQFRKYFAAIQNQFGNTNNSVIILNVRPINLNSMSCFHRPNGRRVGNIFKGILVNSNCSQFAESYSQGPY